MSAITTDIINSYRKKTTPVVLLPQELFMKKIILLLITLFLGSTLCFAWEPDPIGYEVDNIPEYKEYFEEYAQRLYENFQPQKHFIGIYGTYDGFTYTIFRDGTIKDIVNDFNNEKSRYVKYCNDIINSTHAKPFPEAIKDDFIVVDLLFGYYHNKRHKVLLYGRTKSNLWLYWRDRYKISSVNIIKIYIEKKNYLHKFSK